MAQGKQEVKFERNPWNSFRDNRCHRQTNFDLMSSADIVKQSYKCRPTTTQSFLSDFEFLRSLKVT